MQCVAVDLNGSPYQCEYQAAYIAVGHCSVVMPVCPAHAFQVDRTILTAKLTGESLPCLVLTDSHRPHGMLPEAMLLVSVN